MSDSRDRIIANLVAICTISTKVSDTTSFIAGMVTQEEMMLSLEAIQSVGPEVIGVMAENPINVARWRIALDKAAKKFPEIPRTTLLSIMSFAFSEGCHGLGKGVGQSLMSVVGQHQVGPSEVAQ